MAGPDTARPYLRAAAVTLVAAACLLSAVGVLRAGEDASLEERARIQGWIVLLDDDDSAVRAQAEAELARIGEKARPFLDEARKSAKPEARRRIDAILAKLADAGRTSSPLEWPGLRGGPQRSGVVGGGIPRTAPSLVWEMPVPDEFPLQGALAATSDCVVTLSLDGHVRSFDAATGDRRWLAVLDGKVTASAAIAVDRVLVPTTAGVIALAPADGHETWRIPGEYGSNAAPAICGARAFVALKGRGILGVDLRTGEPFLDRKLAPQGALLADADLLVTAAEDGTLRSIDPATGRDRWKIDLGGSPVMGPTLAAPGAVVVFTADGGLQARRTSDGSQIWSRRLATSSASESISAAAGRVCLPDTSGFLHVYDAATGRELWNRCEGFLEMGAPAVTADVVCLGTRGRLTCRDAANGNYLWRVDVPQRESSSPISAGGRLFVLDAGRLRCMK